MQPPHDSHSRIEQLSRNPFLFIPTTVPCEYTSIVRVTHLNVTNLQAVDITYICEKHFPSAKFAPSRLRGVASTQTQSREPYLNVSVFPFSSDLSKVSKANYCALLPCHSTSKAGRSRIHESVATIVHSRYVPDSMLEPKRETTHIFILQQVKDLRILCRWMWHSNR